MASVGLGCPGRRRTWQRRLHLPDQPPVGVLARAHDFAVGALGHRRGGVGLPSTVTSRCHYVEHGVEVRQVPPQRRVVRARLKNAAILPLHEDLRGPRGTRFKVPWRHCIERDLAVPAREARGLQLGEACVRPVLELTLDAGPHRAVAVEDAGPALNSDCVPARAQEAVPIVAVERVLRSGRDSTRNPCARARSLITSAMSAFNIACRPRKGLPGTVR